MSKKSLLEKGICDNGHKIKSEADLYTTPYNHKGQGQGVDKRCRECHLDRARLISRKKRGTPLEQPVRPYKERRTPNRTKATMELIKLVSADPELAERLLAIAKEQKEVECWMPT
jgi:hypothetical protein